MKKLFLFLLVCCLAGCQKKQTQPPQSNENIVQLNPCPTPPNLVDVLWKPVLTGYIDIAFASDGSYYEDTINSASKQGTWRTGCPGDSIVIQKQFYKVQYRIVSVSADTLKLINPVNFVNVYHK